MTTRKKPTAAQRAKEAAKQERRAERIRRDNRRTRLIGVGLLAVLVGVIAFAIAKGNSAADTESHTNSPLVPGAQYAKGKEWTLTLTTPDGDIVMTLDGKHAPQASSVILSLNQEGFYDGTDCHRVRTIEPFFLQCGDPTGTGTGGPPYRFGPIENAPTDNVYPAGSVVMVRNADDAYSMGSQFFIVYKDSHIPADKAGGFTVVGTVTQGLDIVRSVAEGGTITGASDGRPAQPVILTKVTTS